jgi:hypothetical protein
VVEGHRDADPVVLVVAAALADEERVVRMLWWLSVAPLGKPVY